MTSDRRSSVYDTSSTSNASSSVVDRILAIGDLHYKTTNIRESKELEVELIRIIQEQDPKFVVLLGDTLDKHENIHPNPLKRAVKFIKRVASMKPVFLLIGNHDRPNNEDFLSEYHPFVGLEDHYNITIVSDIVMFDNYLFVPYVYPGRFMEAILTKKSKGNSKVHCIFAHQEFYGAEYGAVSKKGDKWDLSYPYIVSGHIHKFQQLQANILYTGTPMQQTFDEEPDKSISMITITDGIVSHERIFVKVTTKITVTCESLTQEITDQILQLSLSHIVRVKITGAHSDQKAQSYYIRILRKNNVKVVNEIDKKIVTQKLSMRSTACSGSSSFNDILMNLISNDPQMISVYKELCD